MKQLNRLFHPLSRCRGRPRAFPRFLEAFRKAGKINYAGFQLDTITDGGRLAAERLCVQGFVASQNMWGLAKPDLSEADSERGRSLTSHLSGGKSNMAFQHLPT